MARNDNNNLAVTLPAELQLPAAFFRRTIMFENEAGNL